MEASFNDKVLAKSLEQGAAADQSLARMLEKFQSQVEKKFAAKGLFIIKREPMQLATLDEDQPLRRMIKAALDLYPKATATSLAAAIMDNPKFIHEIVEASFNDEVLAKSLERGEAVDQSLARILDMERRRMKPRYAEQGLSLVENHSEILEKIDQLQSIRSMVAAALELDKLATAASLNVALQKNPSIAQNLVRASILDDSLKRALEKVPSLAKVLKTTAYSSLILEESENSVLQLEHDQSLRRSLESALEHDPQTAASILRALENKPWTVEVLVRASLIDQALAVALERDQALARKLESVRPQIEAKFAAEGLFIVAKRPNLLASLEIDQTLRSMLVAALKHDLKATTTSLTRAIASEGQWVADFLVRASLKDQALAGALERGAAADQSLAEALEKVRPRVEAELKARGEARLVQRQNKA